MTSTLQQEGGRQLRWSSSQVMRVAQGLYERGFITYMRTDAVVLSDEALQAVRAAITSEYGASFLSPSPRRYTSRVKNAQEAHEAIRPTTPLRSPQQVAGELNGHELALYRLIWQRTLASQMADATGHTVTVRIGAIATDGRDAEFSASGTTITFPGYRQVYVEARDEGDDATTTIEREELLPPLASGRSSPSNRWTRVVTPPRRRRATPKLHSSSAWRNSASVAPRRGRRSSRRSRTAATCGRRARRSYRRGRRSPSSACSSSTSTNSSTTPSPPRWRPISTPSPPASNARTPGCTTSTSATTRRATTALPGLKRLVEENLDSIDAAAINTFPIGHDADGNVVVVKPGRYGPYVKRGDDTAGVPDDLPPDELTIDLALSLLAAPKADEPIGELDGPAGVRQERSLRPVCAARYSRRSPARSRQTEDGQLVQVDVARAPDARRRRSAAQPARARSAPILPTANRCWPATVRTARTCRRPRSSAPSIPKSGCSPSLSPRPWSCSPHRRCTSAAPATWPPADRCASSVTIR